MYIPYEVIWFLLGFIAFPIFVYAIWELFLKNKYEKQDKDKEG